MTDNVAPGPALDNRLPVGLLVLRIFLGLFFLQWTVEKFIKPAGTAKIFDHFYGIDLAAGMPMIIGVVELVIVIAFLAGFHKRISYGLLLLFHAGSTLSSYDQLLHPYDKGNHLFAAAVPVLAAFWLLYWLRDHDTIWSLDAKKAATADTT
ncbi:MAG: DoxX family protein [Sphingomonadales bacterium]